MVHMLHTHTRSGSRSDDVGFSKRTTALALALTLLFALTAARADAPKVYDGGAKPADSRFDALKTLDGYFPFNAPTSKPDWDRRAAFVRKQIKLACGLWPMPTRAPLNAVVHGKRDFGEYTIEKVYLESYPGHFVTGSLYRPAGASLKHGAKDGKRPVVLCPHGHWGGGRFVDHGEANAKKYIEQGAEKLMPAARSHMQARCVQLARMGCIVFHYDMEGYADSVQFAHRPGVREHMNTKENWGFFSPQAELRLQGMFGLQTFNSVRALDFVLSLDGADEKRVTITGASGGGTQAMILAAIDDRVTVSVPAVMVSTSMQGGCTCENANYLRLNSGNIEIAAVFAPKPQFLIAADDWTKELMQKGFPELKQTYGLLGQPNHIDAAAHLQFKHNYNEVNRQHMYHWLNEHFDLGFKTPIEEREFEFLTEKDLTVWDDKHPKPKTGDSHERELVAWMTKDADKQFAALKPKDEKSLRGYKDVVGGALEVMINRSFSDVGEVKWHQEFKQDRGDYFAFAGRLESVSFKEELPAAFFMAKNWNKQVVVWVDPRGKAALFDDDGSPAPAVSELIDAGFAVGAVDLFYTGEFLAPGEDADKARIQHYGNGKNPWHHYTGYTFGYNHALFAQRVHDVMTLVAFARQYEGHPPDKVHLVGANGGGRFVAAAAAMLGDKVEKVAVDAGGFRFAELNRFDHPEFLPGAVKYGDVAGMIALRAPRTMMVAGVKDKQGQSLIEAAYKAGGASDKLTIVQDNAAMTGKLTAWLLK